MSPLSGRSHELSPSSYNEWQAQVFKILYLTHLAKLFDFYDLEFIIILKVLKHRVIISCVVSKHIFAANIIGACNV